MIDFSQTFYVVKFFDVSTGYALMVVKFSRHVGVFFDRIQPPLVMVPPVYISTRPPDIYPVTVFCDPQPFISLNNFRHIAFPVHDRIVIKQNNAAGAFIVPGSVVGNNLYGIGTSGSQV